jgi:ATP synthase protein I
MKDDDKRQLLTAFGMVGNVGITMVAAAAVGLFGGRFIDDKLGSSPWFTIIGILSGLISGMWSAYKQVVRK